MIIVLNFLPLSHLDVMGRPSKLGEPGDLPDKFDTKLSGVKA